MARGKVARFIAYNTAGWESGNRTVQGDLSQCGQEWLALTQFAACPTFEGREQVFADELFAGALAGILNRVWAVDLPEVSWF